MMVISNCLEKFKAILVKSYLATRKSLLFLFLLLKKDYSPGRQELKKILVLRYDRIGDMILSTPLFKSLKKNIPGCHIIVLASEKNRKILDHNPDVDEVLVYEGIFKFWRDFRGKDIDLAMDLFYAYDLKSAFLALLSRAKYRVGFKESGREIFFNINGPRLYPFKHMVYHLLDLLIPLGIYEDQARPQIYLTQEEIDSAKKYFKEKNFSQEELKIAVNPGTYYASQRWPVERFAELIKKISTRFNVRVILFTDKRDEWLLRQMLGILGPTGVESMHGLDLRQFIVYLSQCHLLICNNSGPVHIASGLGIPTVSIMGPTRADLWRPFGVGHTVINKNLPCSPCNRGVCHQHDCMNLVKVDEVFKKVSERIDKIKSGISDKMTEQDNLRIRGMRKILIINLGGVGDILLSTVALKALKEAYLDAEINILAVPRTREFAGSLGYLDRVFVLKKNNRLANIFFNLITIYRLRRKNFDLCINMRTLVSEISAAKIKLLLSLINPKIKAGRNTDHRGDFFDLSMPEAEPGEKYEMFYDIDTIRALGVTKFDNFPVLNINIAAENKIKDMLRRHSIREGDILLGINPMSSLATRRWPLENFASAIDLIAQQISSKFVITCLDSEIPLARKILALSKSSPIIMGGLNVEELAALIKRCNVYISNDTGPMHIAAVLKTPLLAIFGPGCIVRFDPRNISDKAMIIQKAVDCAPCNKTRCESMKCLKSISPEEVADAALFLLKANKQDN